MCSFRYVEHPSPDCVTLSIFRTPDGLQGASVLGPRTRVLLWTYASEQITCVPPAEAFSAGIRMANRFDVELVVSGDASLWQLQWGQLSMHKPANTVDRLLGLPVDIFGTPNGNSPYSG